MIWEIVILSEVASLSSWNVMNHRFAFLKSTTLHLVLNQRRIHLCTVPTGGRRERHSVLKRVWQNSDTWVHTRYETIAYCNSWDTHILLVVLLLTCEGSMLRITGRIYIYNKHKQCINKKKRSNWCVMNNASCCIYRTYSWKEHVSFTVDIWPSLFRCWGAGMAIVPWLEILDFPFRQPPVIQHSYGKWPMDDLPIKRWSSIAM